MSFVLAIDQGTTSSRAMVFRGDISIAAVAQQEFPQHFPASGWVEHEPEDIWTSTVMVCREALEKAGLKAKDIAAIGITNQRETTVVPPTPPTPRARCCSTSTPAPGTTISSGCCACRARCFPR